MKLATIRKKAKSNSLEVEDILAAAKERVPGLQQALDELSKKYQWSSTPYPADGDHVVPLAKWAEIAGTYAEGGLEPMRAMAAHEENYCFIIALLEEVRSVDAAYALFEFFHDHIRAADWSKAATRELVQAINLLFFLSGKLTPTPEQAERARRFLYLLFKKANTEAEKVLVVCALRGVGNEDTIRFISALPPFAPPFSRLEKTAARELRKRLEVVSS